MSYATSARASISSFLAVQTLVGNGSHSVARPFKFVFMFKVMCAVYTVPDLYIYKLSIQKISVTHTI